MCATSRSISWLSASGGRRNCKLLGTCIVKCPTDDTRGLGVFQKLSHICKRVGPVLRNSDGLDVGTCANQTHRSCFTVAYRNTMLDGLPVLMIWPVGVSLPLLASTRNATIVSLSMFAQ